MEELIYFFLKIIIYYWYFLLWLLSIIVNSPIDCLDYMELIIGSITRWFDVLNIYLMKLGEVTHSLEIQYKGLVYAIKFSPNINNVPIYFYLNGIYQILWCIHSFYISDYKRSILMIMIIIIQFSVYLIKLCIVSMIVVIHLIIIVEFFVNIFGIDKLSIVTKYLVYTLEVMLLILLANVRMLHGFSILIVWLIIEWLPKILREGWRKWKRFWKIMTL